MLEIRAPEIFPHAGMLSPRDASYDPRKAGPGNSSVCIDLRECQFIHPPAVLWCIVYSAVTRWKGIDCELLVPENFGVATYLKTLGLFSMLEEIGVSVDARDLGTANDSQVIVPLQRFIDISQVEQLADVALERLSADKPVAGNLSALISNTFAELGNNAAEHADSSVGAFGMVQFYDPPGRGTQFWCVVADGGMGIRASLSRNPTLKPRYEWTAIEEALKEQVTGTGLPHRGFGLFGIAQDMRSLGHEFIIHSGTGMMHLQEEDSVPVARRCSVPFPGTLTAARISL